MTRTLDSEEQLETRLRSMPRLWRDPARRYDRVRAVQADALEGAFIARTANGEVERVRFASDFGGRHLLLNEYDALSKVEHPSVVSLRWAGVRRGRLYVATTWMEEGDDEREPIPLLRLMNQIETCARGVGAMHAAGLVHGDLKPETLLRGRERCLVTDLKLATDPGVRRDASYSPKFAAPEQVLEEHVGPQSDVYALGVAFYTLFLKERFPSLLRTHGDSITSAGDAGVGLSAITATRNIAADGGEHDRQQDDRVVGAKVMFRSRLRHVVDGVEHAERMGSILEVIRKACDLNPDKRYPDAPSFADAVHSLLPD